MARDAYIACRQPANPGPAGWRALLAPRQVHAHAPLQGRNTADAVVVGAGFAGLFAAHRLRALRPEWRIVLLEAHRIADGPSGRNSGFMIDLPHVLTSGSYHEGGGDERASIAMNRHAIDAATRCVEHYGIEPAAFERSGKINGAAHADGAAKNAQYAEHLKTLGEAHERLDAKAMRDITGSAHYIDGLYTPGTVMLQPALFVQQMAVGLAREGVTVCERSAVRAVAREGSDWRVECADGAGVTAPQVVLAVNGHVESFGLYRHRLMHVFTYASVTRPLSGDECKRLGGRERWALTPADPMGTTLRRITGPDGTRLVVRNRFTFEPSMQISAREFEAAQADQRKSFETRFPMLSAVPMEHRWGGHLCLSRNEVHAFGRVDEGLYAAACCNGLGTVQSTLSGLLVAELICGVDSAHLRRRQAEAAPSLVLPGPWTTWAANRVIAHRERRAGVEK